MNDLRRRVAPSAILALTTALLLVPGAGGPSAVAADPSAQTMGAPPLDHRSRPVTQKILWTGNFAGTGAMDPAACVDAPSTTATTCDTETLHLTIPRHFWRSHRGSLRVRIWWRDSSAEVDLYAYDADGTTIGRSTRGDATHQRIALGRLSRGTYTFTAANATGVPGTTYAGRVAMTSQRRARR
ncbi:hypothetical protein [Nocardioides mangrovi]|uniref:Uncharacterized protein n=1 Tax=Nocardioides mangrovi TaxID=2874580 RepID=A0ABS7UD84_9ACTN|nr:hypothetical protein [Nocardioides mangrovi]MBZ5738968.1 hypothetical protein [Nocardioides mangrovi]